MEDLRNGSLQTSLFQAFEGNYLQETNKEKLQKKTGLIFRSEGFIGELLDSLPKIKSVFERQTYFEEILPFEPKSPDFANIISDSTKLSSWNSFIFLLRRTVEERDIETPMYRFSEPKNTKVINSKAFEPQGHNKLNIDDSLGFLCPY